MGRPSFIKWHEKEEYKHQLQKKGVLYLHTENGRKMQNSDGETDNAIAFVVLRNVETI